VREGEAENIRQCENRNREMAWNGRFGNDEEGSGLELSLSLPGYFSGSPTQAAAGAAASFMCLITYELVPWLGFN
jgi:hypothetical protein